MIYVGLLIIIGFLTFVLGSRYANNTSGQGLLSAATGNLIRLAGAALILIGIILVFVFK